MDTIELKKKIKLHKIPSSELSDVAAGRQDLEAYGKNYPFLRCPSS